MVLPAPPAPFPAFNTGRLAAGRDAGSATRPGLRGRRAQSGVRAARPGSRRSIHPDGHLPADTVCGHDVRVRRVRIGVPRRAAPRARRSSCAFGRVRSRAVSFLELRIDLLLAQLHEPDLNRLRPHPDGPHRHAADAYAATARWAEAFHRADPAIAGLGWTSRRCDPASPTSSSPTDCRKARFHVADRIELAALREAIWIEIRNFGRRPGITLTI